MIKWNTLELNVDIEVSFMKSQYILGTRSSDIFIARLNICKCIWFISWLHFGNCNKTEMGIIYDWNKRKFDCSRIYLYHIKLCIKSVLFLTLLLVHPFNQRFFDFLQGMFKVFQLHNFRSPLVYLEVLG